MTRDDALQLMSCRLYAVLNLMFAAWRRWRPDELAYRSSSPGFRTGGSVSSFEDLENECDQIAIGVIEAGWSDLTQAERICVEMVVGVQPWVWTVRPGVLESAVRKLEAKLRQIGAA